MIKNRTISHVEIACLKHNTIVQRCVTNKVQIRRRFLRHFDSYVPNCSTRHHTLEGYNLGVLYSKGANVTVGISQLHYCPDLEG